MAEALALAGAGALGAVNLLVMLGLALFGLNAWVMVILHRRHRAAAPMELPAPAAWPAVTVQLPVFNERYVAGRLLAAAAALDYPRDRLEIQVLDDSTDDTAAIVAAAVRDLRRRGLEVVHVRRARRTGFKAGALAEGLARARGEFVAVFDADFVPAPDFLRRTVPWFADARVGVVQARWGHLNRDFSLLTAAQALGIDGHFVVEQAARSRGGLLLNFNGTAGVWRRAAIEDAGGWAHDTLTEDLDLSYRAQLRGWRILYRPDVVCPAEIPALITGFKSQQRRWARGSIQTARKLLPAVLAAPLPRWVRYQAAVHLTYYLIHPLMLATLLLSVPLLAVRERLPAPGDLGGLVLLLTATLGPATMLAYAQAVQGGDWGRRLARLPALMVIGVGLAWSTSLAVLAGFRRRPGEFVRTPKFGIGPAGGHWRGKAYGDRRSGGGLAELGLGLYCGWGAWLFWRQREYGMVPFLLLYAAGFLVVGTLTIRHALAARRAAGPGLRLARRPLTASVALGLVVATACPAWGQRPGAGAREPLTAPLDRVGDGGPGLIAEGARFWAAPPVARDAVACATCHRDPAEPRSWAVSYPRFRPLPPPHGRVMTLLQATAEAVARHYPSAGTLPVATAITAYLTAGAAGEPVAPGGPAGEPLFPARRRALAASIERGAGQWARRCAGCHALDRAAGALAWPGGRPPELFLAGHGPAPLAWDSPAMADLLAFLASRRAGRPLEVSLDGGAPGPRPPEAMVPEVQR